MCSYSFTNYLLLKWALEHKSDEPMIYLMFSFVYVLIMYVAKLSTPIYINRLVKHEGTLIGDNRSAQFCNIHN